MNPEENTTPQPPQAPPSAQPVAPAVSPAVQSPAPQTPPAVPAMLCPQCHFPVKPEYYYCPNSGKSLRMSPLSTSVGTQIWIYAFSIILPAICFLAVSYWPGVKYIKSEDPQAQQIGIVAAVLLGISTIITFWLGIIWIQQAVQSSVNSIGNLGGY